MNATSKIGTRLVTFFFLGVTVTVIAALLPQTWLEKCAKASDTNPISVPMPGKTNEWYVTKNQEDCCQMACIWWNHKLGMTSSAAVSQCIEHCEDF